MVDISVTEGTGLSLVFLLQRTDVGCETLGSDGWSTIPFLFVLGLDLFFELLRLIGACK